MLYGAQKYIFVNFSFFKFILHRTLNIGLKCDKTVDTPSTTGILEAPTNTYVSSITFDFWTYLGGPIN